MATKLELSTTQVNWRRAAITGKAFTSAHVTCRFADLLDPEFRAWIIQVRSRIEAGGEFKIQIPPTDADDIIKSKLFAPAAELEMDAVRPV